MLALTLGLLVAAVPPPEVKLAAPGLTTSGLDPSTAGPLTDHLARAFSGVRVITPRDIGALLGLERQKELLGCTDQASQCMTELGNALGVQGVLLGDLVKLGSAVQINLRIIDPVAGRELAATAERVDSESEIFDALTRAGERLRVEFLKSIGVVVRDVPIRRGGARRFFPIPVAVGAAALIGGCVLLGLSEMSYQRLTSGPQGSVSSVDAASVARTGDTFQTVGWVVVGVGIAAALAGLATLIFGSGGP